MRRRLLSQAGYKPIDINNYLTMEALMDDFSTSLSKYDCEYCVDGNGHWKKLKAGTYTESIDTGQTLSFRANNIPDRNHGIGTFESYKNRSFKLLGVALSMIYGDEVKYKNDEYKGCPMYAFMYLFKSNYGLIDVNENFLPSKSVNYRSYYYTFHDCTNMKSCPKLNHITSISDGSFYGMYSYCTELEFCNFPKIYKEDSHAKMYEGCKLSETLILENLGSRNYGTAITSMFAFSRINNVILTNFYSGIYSYENEKLFYSCKSLTNVHFINSTFRMSLDNAFKECTLNTLVFNNCVIYNLGNLGLTYLNYLIISEDLIDFPYFRTHLPACNVKLLKDGEEIDYTTMDLLDPYNNNEIVYTSDTFMINDTWQNWFNSENNSEYNPLGLYVDTINDIECITNGEVFLAFKEAPSSNSYFKVQLSSIIRPQHYYLFPIDKLSNSTITV